MKRSHIVDFITLGVLIVLGLGLIVAINPMMEVYGHTDSLMNLAGYIGEASSDFALKAGYILLTLFQIFSILFSVFALMRMASRKEESGFVWSIVSGLSFLVQFIMMICYYSGNAYIVSFSAVGLIALIAGAALIAFFIIKEKEQA